MTVADYQTQTFNLEESDVRIVEAAAEELKRQGLRASKSDAARMIFREWAAMKGALSGEKNTQVSDSAG
jgi:hypothetical protein